MSMQRCQLQKCEVNKPAAFLAAIMILTLNKRFYALTRFYTDTEVCIQKLIMFKQSLCLKKVTFRLLLQI